MPSSARPPSWRAAWPARRPGCWHIPAALDDRDAAGALTGEVAAGCVGSWPAALDPSEA